MDRERREHLFLSVKDIIKMEAISASRFYGGEIDDWIGTFSLEVWKFLPLYDSRKASIGTFVRMICRTKAKREFNRTRKRKIPMVSITTEDELDTISCPTSWLEKIKKELSQDGRDILHTILGLPKDIVSLKGGGFSYLRKEKIKLLIWKELEEKGWERDRFYSAYRELREVVLIT